MDYDLVSCLFNSSLNSSNSNQTIQQNNESISVDDVSKMLFHSFNEAEDSSNDEEESEEIDWGLDEDSEEDSNNSSEETEESEEEVSEESTESENEDEIEDTKSDEDVESEDEDSNEYEESSEEGEILGSYEAIKDELESEREVLSDVYERFFKEIVDPLFRKLEDSNINVAFDTTKLKSEGIIRVELSHRNSDATAEMEINIFANTVNGEFLGMENTEGEAITTSLDDVSLDDLLNILIKVLC